MRPVEMKGVRVPKLLLAGLRLARCNGEVGQGFSEFGFDVGPHAFLRFKVGKEVVLGTEAVNL
jgi:hypothetical protein